MRNEAADIVQDTTDDLRDEAMEWKSKAREAGTAAWDATRAAYQQLQQKTSECTEVTDKAIRENPYIAMGAAFGIGLLLGCLMTGGSDDSED